MDLMLMRWELHPSCSLAIEDTGTDGKHYCVLGQDKQGQVHFPTGFQVVEVPVEGTLLSKTKSQQGWVRGVKNKDRMSKVF